MRLISGPQVAETLALKALAFLASSGETLERFLALTGIAPEDLRAHAGEAEVLAAVLDFLLASDELLTQFAAQEEIAPLDVHAARRFLPGGIGNSG